MESGMDEIDVFGLPIPNAGPVFLAALAVHVAAGSTCVISGAVAALSRKGNNRHVRSGRIYFWGLAALFVTATIMAAIRWQENAHLFAIGLLAFCSVLTGVLDRRSTRSNDIRHTIGMGLSYVTLLTGFYVDNGPHLPLWNLLPPWAFWVLPSLIGLPLIARAVHRRRTARAVEGVT
jgi:uncharacterized membrane protein HdeD (DUF308 family)